MWYVHTMEQLLALKEKAVLPYVTLLINLENVMVSEISQRWIKTAWFNLNDISKIVKLIETEQNDGFQVMMSEGNGELLFNEYKSHYK